MFIIRKVLTKKIDCVILKYIMFNASHRHHYVTRVALVTLSIFTLMILIIPALASQTIENIETRYVITTITYDTTGRINKTALAVKLDLKEDLTFFSLPELLEYIENKKAELTNLRPLTDMSTVVFTHDWNEQLEQYDVTLIIYATEGWNFILLPYFRYRDTANGPRTSISPRYRDYNFAGSLEPLAINMDYNMAFLENGEFDQNIATSVEFQYPFQYDKHRFALTTVDSFVYQIGDVALSNDLVLNLQYSYPLTSMITLQALTYQRGYTNLYLAEPDYAGTFTYGENALGYSTVFQLNRIPLPIFETIKYTPLTQYTIRYPIAERLSDRDDRYNQKILASHQLRAGKSSWIRGSFFRQGLTMSARNSYTYEIDNANGWEIEVQGEAIAHYTSNNILGINTRAIIDQRWYLYPNSVDISVNGPEYDNRLRGILDTEVDNSHTAFVFNSEILFRLFQLQPLAEFQMGPLMDVMVRRRHNIGGLDTGYAPFDPSEDLHVTAGIEGLAHALFANSIVVRGSYGIDVGELVESGSYSLSNREIFIGVGLYY